MTTTIYGVYTDEEDPETGDVKLEFFLTKSDAKATRERYRRIEYDKRAEPWRDAIQSWKKEGKDKQPEYARYIPEYEKRISDAEAVSFEDWERAQYGADDDSNDHLVECQLHGEFESPVTAMAAEGIEVSWS